MFANTMYANMGDNMIVASNLTSGRIRGVRPSRQNLLVVSGQEHLGVNKTLKVLIS